MTIKHLFQLIFFVFLFGCSNNSGDITKRDRIGEKQFGLFIEIGPRQGYQFFDATGTEHNYRHYTITVTNDSITPVDLEIYFPKTAQVLKDSCKSKVFLIPRLLTQHLYKTLKPTEKCVFILGVLTDTRCPDPTTPFDTRILTSNEHSSVISIKLKLNDTLKIPCGQFSYVKK